MSYIRTEEWKERQRINATKQWKKLSDVERKEIGKNISEGKGSLSEETKEKIRIARSKQVMNNLGKKNPMWKGDKAGVEAKHLRIRNALPEPECCPDCGKEGPLDLCNVDHQYNAEKISDWMYKCRRCHMIFDNRI